MYKVVCEHDHSVIDFYLTHPDEDNWAQTIASLEQGEASHALLDHGGPA